MKNYVIRPKYKLAALMLYIYIYIYIGWRHYFYVVLVTL